MFATIITPIFFTFSWLFGATAAALALVSLAALLHRRKRRRLVAAVSVLGYYLIAFSLLCTSAYVWEYAWAFTHGDKFERHTLASAASSWTWLGLIPQMGTLLVPHLFWWRRVRLTPWLSLLLSALVLFSLNWERMVIAITERAAGGYLPETWRQP